MNPSPKSSPAAGLLTLLAPSVQIALRNAIGKHEPVTAEEEEPGAAGS